MYEFTDKMYLPRGNQMIVDVSFCHSHLIVVLIVRPYCCMRRVFRRRARRVTDLVGHGDRCEENCRSVPQHVRNSKKVHGFLVGWRSLGSSPRWSQWFGAEVTMNGARLRRVCHWSSYFTDWGGVDDARDRRSTFDAIGGRRIVQDWKTWAGWSVTSRRHTLKICPLRKKRERNQKETSTIIWLPRGNYILSVNSYRISRNQ